MINIQIEKSKLNLNEILKFSSETPLTKRPRKVASSRSAFIQISANSQEIIVVKAYAC
jgi:hypothetical protein